MILVEAVGEEREDKVLGHAREYLEEVKSTEFASTFNLHIGLFVGLLAEGNVFATSHEGNKLVYV
jgi:hypothetical protein